MAAIAALSFDLWDTLVVDDSDEPLRRARGLAPKAEAREALFVEEIAAQHPELPEERLRAAHAEAQRRFRHAWKVEHRTPSLADRLAVALDWLGIGPTPGFPAMLEAYGSMEVRCPPRPAPGAKELLARLHGRLPLVIVSDAIVTPGRGLREILAGHGMRDAFAAFVFSDEVGAAKPDPQVFRVAAERLGVEPASLVHIGDREANDVAGARAVGARSVLYTGVVDRGSEHSAADAVCSHHEELPGLIERWLGEQP